MKKILLPILALAAIVGCSENNEGTQTVISGIDFISSVKPTRAVVDNSSAFAFSILRGTDGAAPAFDQSTNVISADRAADGKITVGTAQSFNAAHINANFIAYYPAGTPTSSKVGYVIDGAMDIVAAPAVAAVYSASSASTCQFVFKHLLSQIELQVKAADAATVTSFGNLTKATVTVPTALDMAIASSGAATIAANSTDAKNLALDFGAATLAAGSGVSAAKILMVNPVAPTKIKLTFANKAETEYDINNLVLEAGAKTVVLVNVSLAGVSFTSTIEPWRTGGTDGAVTIE